MYLSELRAASETQSSCNSYTYLKLAWYLRVVSGQGPSAVYIHLYIRSWQSTLNW